MCDASARITIAPVKTVKKRARTRASSGWSDADINMGTQLTRSGLDTPPVFATPRK